MGRSPCCDKNGLKKGPWTPEEDLKLIEYIQTHGPGNWRTLPKNAGLQRCGKSCRLRWTNYLRPDIKRGRFSFEEEETIIQLHSVLGNKWSAIAARLPGRTDNEIKNYWNTHIRKRLLRMGIDPVTHSPRLDLLDLSSLLNSTQLNLSNLLGLQALVNPEILRLAAAILASNSTTTPTDQNLDILLQQKLQENQLLSVQMQNPEISLQKLQENRQLLNTQVQNQTPIFQTDHTFQGNVISSTSLDGQNLLQENFMTRNTSFPSNTPSYGDLGCEKMGNESCENSTTLQSLNNSSNLGSPDFSFDSVLATPLSSSTPLNSSSTFMNSSTEDERESFCSSLMKFAIPDTLDLDEFL